VDKQHKILCFMIYLFRYRNDRHSFQQTKRFVYHSMFKHRDK